MLDHFIAFFFQPAIPVFFEFAFSLLIITTNRISTDNAVYVYLIKTYRANNNTWLPKFPDMLPETNILSPPHLYTFLSRLPATFDPFIEKYFNIIVRLITTSCISILLFYLLPSTSAFYATMFYILFPTKYFLQNSRLFALNAREFYVSCYSLLFLAYYITQTKYIAPSVSIFCVLVMYTMALAMFRTSIFANQVLFVLFWFSIFAKCWLLSVPIILAFITPFFIDFYEAIFFYSCLISYWRLYFSKLVDIFIFPNKPNAFVDLMNIISNFKYSSFKSVYYNSIFQFSLVLPFSFPLLVSFSITNSQILVFLTASFFGFLITCFWRFRAFGEPLRYLECGSLPFAILFTTYCAKTQNFYFCNVILSICLIYVVVSIIALRLTFNNSDSSLLLSVQSCIQYINSPSSTLLCENFSLAKLFFGFQKVYCWWPSSYQFFGQDFEVCFRPQYPYLSSDSFNKLSVTQVPEFIVSTSEFANSLAYDYRLVLNCELHYGGFSYDLYKRFSKDSST